MKSEPMLNHWPHDLRVSKLLRYTVNSDLLVSSTERSHPLDIVHGATLVGFPRWQSLWTSFYGTYKRQRLSPAFDVFSYLFV